MNYINMVFNIQEGTFKTINPFLANLFILNSLKKKQETKDLLMFSRDTKLEHWPEMG